jgi:voltage-gated potassium channel
VSERGDDFSSWRGHFVVCGVGPTGRIAVQELAATGRRFVAIEADPATAAAMRDLLPGIPLLEGDATDEEVLQRAGVAGAAGVLTTLADDKLNLVVTVTCRSLHPGVRIVSRGTAEELWERLRREGARVVSPHAIAGRRLANTLLHTSAASFLSEMLAAPSERAVRFEAVEVVAGSPADGRTLGELDAYALAGLRVAALRNGASGPFACNPGPGTRLAPGHRLVVIGDAGAVARLAREVGRWDADAGPPPEDPS